MSDWGICTTVKAPLEQVQAFAAYHLDLGAAHIWLHFDDPEDPAAAAFDDPRITCLRCTDAYWLGLIGKRPERHQNRQGRNMHRVYKTGALPWIAHIDVDEYLLPNYPIGEILDTAQPEQLMLRMAPWEALHDAALADDIFTANHFRAALRGDGNHDARARAFSKYAALLPHGVLSHAAGKCFFRTGLSRFEPRLHGAFRAGVRVPGGEFTENIALLHFHAQDPARWKDRLHFRLTRGAYQYNPALQEWLLAADDAAIDRFYQETQTATPDTLRRLGDEGVLLEAKLGLRDRITAQGWS
ncbi:glycosyltransferase family 2 protein [Pseudorhodobacter sp.]|uniref:glycosyltransferase family 2 protein n=1 Tax=Pseudorhodobacter sp. TaxID=1934400 RepID=UPI002648CFE5|nr:glycosyltransferase family 2 protein [Pseudorhodobacter sp.]MDN5787239.1 glycosyltransferase family 2 protein [Pseudorhodobacter sp.]